MPTLTPTYEVPYFETVEGLREAISNPTVETDLYPRDGTKRLAEVEARFARLTNVEPDQLALFNSGMSAVTGTIDALLERDSVLAFSETAYSQTRAYVDRLRELGYRVADFDSGDTADVEATIKRVQPSIIFSETVGNGPATPVLDVAHLRELTASLSAEPVVVLDNTLPLSTGLNLASDKHSNPKQKLVVVESGTKSYAGNQELAGLTYSRHPELIAGIKEHRRQRGLGPGVATIEYLDELVPWLPDFQHRNTRILRNAKSLAYAASRAEGDGKVFKVYHPSLPTHPNSKLASQQLLLGGCPVFFLDCFLGEIDQYELAAKLWESKEIRRHADLGQSFGFDRARILPDRNYQSVRISAGAKTDTSAFGCALKRALQAL